MTTKSKEPDFREIPDIVIRNAKSKGADDIVCIASKGTTKQVRFANNSVTASKVYNNISVDIFLTWKKRVVQSEVYDLGNIEGVVDDLLSLARATSENNNYYRLAEGKFKYRKTSPDSRILKLSDESLMKYTEDGINGALNNGAKRVAGTLYTSVSEEVLGTSNGISCSEKSADIKISLRAFAEKDASGHGVSCANSIAGFNPESAGRSAGETARMALKPQEGEPGKYNVLFSPLAIANFIETVGGMASAFDVDSGLSFLKDKVGKKVASDIVSISDDGTIPDGLNSSACDSEGVPTRMNPIIEDGVLKGYLHNTSTAHKFKTETTGNAGLISPHPWNVIFRKGDYSVDELVRETGDGLYITNVWYTRFQNYSAGDFSTIPRDAIFCIKGGKITGAVKNIRVTENMLNVLKSISAAGRDQQQIHWWEIHTPTFTPSILVKNVNITKSTQ